MRLDDIPSLVGLRQQILKKQHIWPLPMFYKHLCSLLFDSGISVAIRFRLANTRYTSGFCVVDFSVASSSAGHRQIIDVWVNFSSQANIPFHIADYYTLCYQAAGGHNIKSLLLNVVFHRFCQILIEHHNSLDLLLTNYLDSKQYLERRSELSTHQLEPNVYVTGWVAKLISLRRSRYGGLAAQSAFYLQYELERIFGVTPVYIAEMSTVTSSRVAVKPTVLGNTAKQDMLMLGRRPTFPGFAYKIVLPEMDCTRYHAIIKNVITTEPFKQLIEKFNGTELNTYLECSVTASKRSVLSHEQKPVLGLSCWLGTSNAAFAVNTFLY